MHAHFTATVPEKMLPAKPQRNEFKNLNDFTSYYDEFYKDLKYSQEFIESATYEICMEYARHNVHYVEIRKKYPSSRSRLSVAKNIDAIYKGFQKAKNELNKKGYFFDMKLIVAFLKRQHTEKQEKVIDDIENLLKFKLVGFNCRRYDNHLLYACLMGYNNEQLYKLSQKIVSGESNCFFGEAYNISYTDVYDFSSKKQSLKKFEIELGIHHQELGLPWDKPVPDELVKKVAEYCDNDVIATEAVFHARKADFTADIGRRCRHDRERHDQQPDNKNYIR